MIVPVVTVETKQGLVEINESDFDKKKHKLASAASIKKASEAKETDTPKK